MTTFVLVSLASENWGFAKASVHAVWNNIPNANLKTSKLHEHFDMARPMLWAMMKNLCELEEPVIILKQPFQN